MIDRIISLSRIFIKNTDQYLKKVNRNRSKDPKNKILFNIILISAITFISYQCAKFYIDAGNGKTFLYMYFIILTVVILIKNILLGANILFFSKELEYVLPMPAKSEELFIAKYISILVSNYKTEAMFGFIPLLLYGLKQSPISISYFLYIPIILILFPIFLVTIICIFEIIMMVFYKLIKNRNIYQVAVSMILLFLLMNIEVSLINIVGKNIENYSKDEIIIQEEDKMYQKSLNKFQVINPSIEILYQSSNFKIVTKNFGKIILLNFISLGILYIISKKLYTKLLLLGTINNIPNKKKLKGKELRSKIKPKSQTRSYIYNEFKNLIKNPIIFMQLVFPVIILLLTIIFMLNTLIPIIEQQIQTDETVKEALAKVEFNSQILFIILAIHQILYSIPAISLTAISREGKRAKYMKTLPISLYKQFLYKNVAQITLNLIISIIVMTLVNLYFTKINIIQIILIFLIAILLNVINSFLMLMANLKNPIVDWDSEIEITKNNPNKVFQYVYTICMVLTLLYFSKIFGELNINKTIIIQLLIFAIILLGINLYVKKNIEKIYKKIN